MIKERFNEVIEIIETYNPTEEVKSGRELRRERRKQQRKEKSIYIKE